MELVFDYSVPRGTGGQTPAAPLTSLYRQTTRPSGREDDAATTGGQRFVRDGREAGWERETADHTFIPRSVWDGNRNVAARISAGDAT